MKTLISTLFLAGSLVLGGCERESINITPRYLNDDKHMDFCIEQPYFFGKKITLFLSNEINGKLMYSQTEIEENSEIYKKYFAN
ncbi:MAG: hypothetical protein AABY06_00550 [Nanoarchaeota archaeon]